MCIENAAKEGALRQEGNVPLRASTFSSHCPGGGQPNMSWSGKTASAAFRQSLLNSLLPFLGPATSLRQ
jgi:hypothetical protein